MSIQEERKATWLDIVREYFPDATEEHANLLLWEHTPFPMGGEFYVRRALLATSRMSKRQVDAFYYAALGDSPKEVAKELGIAPNTARHHIRLANRIWETALQEMLASGATPS